MNLILFFSFLVLLLHETCGVIYHLNESEYGRMPPIYRMDNYKSCFQESHDVYCTLLLELTSDGPNELLHMIKEYSEHYQTHFNHTKLRYGVCVTQQCQDYIQDKTSVSKQSFEGCLNQSFLESYGLKAKLQHYACYNSTDNEYKVDNKDKTAGYIVLVIILANVIGTLYDIWCTSNKRKGKGILLAFSIKRNWIKFVSTKSVSEPRLQSLKSLNGIRCFMVYGGISVHCIFPYLMLGDNIRELEMSYHDFYLRFVFNTTLMMQTFFVISGFLLSYKLQIFSEKEEISWSIVPKAILNRLLRITPVYGFVILMLATWLRFAGPGPLWETTVNVMVRDCQSRWWMNLLYFNNYVDKFSCLPTAWSQAVDIQMFCFGLIVCVLLRTKSMGYKKGILTSLILLGMIIVAVQHYLLDLKALLSFAPSAASEIFVNDINFNQTYIMGHSNACSYIIGICLGYLVYSWQQKKTDLRKYPLLKYIYWAVLPLLFCAILSGSIFSRYAPRDPLYIRVTYAAFIKPVIGTLTAIFIAGTIFKLENVCRKFLEWNLWIVPSKLTYIVYLIHLPYLVIYMNMQTSLIQFTTLSMVSLTIFITVVSFITAIPFYVLIEAPFTEISRCLTADTKNELTNGATKETKVADNNKNNYYKKIE